MTTMSIGNSHQCKRGNFSLKFSAVNDENKLNPTTPNLSPTPETTKQINDSTLK